MNGIHDMGGMHGFGRVEREKDEPVFHAVWEARVLGLSRACSARHLFNIDESRHAIERMAPADYLASSYYERWLDRNVRLLVEKGVITPAELEHRMAQLAQASDPAPPHSDPKLCARMLEMLTERTPYRQPGPLPCFSLGEGVLTRHDAPPGHTRLPRYARGKRGVVAEARGPWVFADTNAHGLGEAPQHLYSVRFDGGELWGASAEPRAAVYIDLWESYLEPA
jgi:nitrile hydratase subunit beta